MSLCFKLNCFEVKLSDRCSRLLMDVNYIGFELEGFPLWVFFINYFVHLDVLLLLKIKFY